MLPLTDEARALLQEVLEYLQVPGGPAFPKAQDFRLKHEQQRVLIDDLLGTYLKAEGANYRLTVDGLVACATPEAKRWVDACNALLDAMKSAYRVGPDKPWSAAALAEKSNLQELEVSVCLTFLTEGRLLKGWTPSKSTGLISEVLLLESVLDGQPIGWPSDPLAAPQGWAPDGPLVRSIEISGYRSFSNFVATFKELTVIIGANASGKSSLFDLLRFLTFASSNPLPPEIDPRSTGRALFHAGGPERFAFVAHVDLGGAHPLRYEAEIQGPIGVPRVVRERLAIEPPASPAFAFLSFRGGQGIVADPTEGGRKRPQWNLAPNELALRRALDPSLLTLSRFQTSVSSWRFYSELDVSGRSAMRRPVASEPEPILAEDGSNLSAVLFWLLTQHNEVWQELETHLASAVPGFRSLNVKPAGGPGTVIAQWREQGVKGELTLADLSEGTLRLLCWATLCLSPSIPPLVCIDEPELGLHPRVLPVLAGLMRLASGRSQVLVATHSPYLLSQFSLDEIAVMRKEDGHSVFLRPGDSKALRREIEEVGGGELARLHISDELEARS